MASSPPVADLAKPGMGRPPRLHGSSTKPTQPAGLSREKAELGDWKLTEAPWIGHGSNSNPPVPDREEERRRKKRKKKT